MELKEIRGGDYSAVINLSRGANCISLRNKRYGAEILREPDYTSGELDNPFLYGMPILFPVNRISGGSFEFEGRTYRFPVNEKDTGCHLHGALHEMPFTVLEYGDDRILCVYRADAEHPYLDFPHAFEIRIEYALSEDGFTHRTEVTNLSDRNMPCLLGFHTTFRACFAKGSVPEDIYVRIGIAEEYERNMRNYLPTGKKPAPDSVTERLSRGEFCPVGERISRHYRASGAMTLTDVRKGLRVVYENDEKYAFRLIYNGNADGYICMEPQTSLANSPNAPISREEAGFHVLAAGETEAYSSKIYLTEEKEK